MLTEKERNPPLALDYVKSILHVDRITGKCYWLAPSKYHPDLLNQEAGGVVANGAGKSYWVIHVDKKTYRRAYIVFLVVNGFWPPELIDHIDGNSLNDCPENIRCASITQNAWNHRHRKKTASTPMGVRTMGRRFQARLAVNKKMLYLGVYDTAEEAHAVYIQKRKELYGAFCGC